MAAPIRDVGAAGRRESFAEARYRCGVGETWRFKDISGLYPFLRKILADVAKKFANARARAFADASAYAQGYGPMRPGDRAKIRTRVFSWNAVLTEQCHLSLAIRPRQLTAVYRVCLSRRHKITRTGSAVFTSQMTISRKVKRTSTRPISKSGKSRGLPSRSPLRHYFLHGGRNRLRVAV